MRFSNPVIPGFYPDPSVCRVGDDFYLVNSSFEYFPGVPVWHSRDLVHWRQIGHCLTRDSQLPLEKAWISGGIYAPTIRYHGGIFYMITTNTSGGGNFYVTARDPAGPWSEPVWIAQDGIDPDLFFDDDGTVYVTSSGRASGECRIVQSVLDLASGTLRDPNRVIWGGTGGFGPEGPHIYKVNGTYYLMIAEGGTEYGHTEVIARGPTPRGPWESCPHNPILSHRSTESPIQCTGHADLVQLADGSWWMVFLGVRPVGYHRAHNLGRETMLTPVRWGADGWPGIGDRPVVSVCAEGPSLAPHPWPVVPVRDDFGGPELGLQWNFIHNPVPGHWSLGERQGWLSLHGPEGDINNMWPTPCFVGCRQRHHRCDIATRLDFWPSGENEEAGLTVFQNMRHHYEIALSVRSGRRCVIVRRRIGSLQAETACAPAPQGAIDLRIHAEPDTYRLEAVGDGGRVLLAHEAEARYLSTEIGGLFTGVYFGMYATGHGSRCGAPAHFDWFDYKPGPEAPAGKV